MMPAWLLACALNVSPVTLEAVMRVESGGNAWAVNVNRLAGLQPSPSSAAEAARVARSFIERGFTVDLGLLQVNDRNLPGLGLTVEQALDPCTNVRAGGAILSSNYAEAAKRLGAGQPALKAALSAYNTGSFARGFTNGYVDRYYGKGTVPAILGRLVLKPRDRALPPNPYTADTQAYAREVADVRVQ